MSEELNQHWADTAQCRICGRTGREVTAELPSQFFETAGAVSINLEHVHGLGFDMPVCVVCSGLFKSIGRPDYSPYEESIDSPLLPEGSADPHASADELALKYAQAAERQLGVISADLSRYVQSLNTPVPVRTADQQANISLGDLELLLQTLHKVGDNLLKIQAVAQESQ